MAKSSRGKVGASKRSAEKGSRDPASAAPDPTTSGVAVASWIPIALIVVSVATALLAVYQWRELLSVQAGGSTFCSINATFNCTSVWDSSFAKTIHAVTRVPVSGWGLVWGFAALAASVAVYMAAKSGQLSARVASPLWVIGAAGVGSCVVFLAVSTSLGVFCITCIATYVLVAVLAFFITKLPRPASANLVTGVSRAAVFVVAGYLLVLYPGVDTPVEAAHGLQLPPIARPDGSGKPRETPKSTGDLLGDYLVQLPDEAKSDLAAALAAYRATPPAVDTSRWATRRLIGAATAPVRIVEFSDIRCGHCKMMSEALEEMSQSTPPGSFSLELRQFPLDPGCNANVLNPKMADATGARCTAAKALVCMEPLDGFRRAQERMFAEQERLTRDRVMEIAVSNGAKLETLMRCLESPDTAAKLNQDIEYAMAFHIEGTPLVIINGREAPTFPQFVYAMVIAGGNANAPGWNVLPPPSAQGGGHKGHGH